jgi:hypothetical protein
VTAVIRKRAIWGVALAVGLALVASSFGLAVIAHAGSASRHPRLSWSTPMRIDPGGGTNDVSCASTSLCVAVDKVGNVVSSTDPAGGSWQVTSADPGVALSAASCPSLSFCAVSGVGDIATSTNPGAATPSWAVAHVEPGSRIESIACPGPRLCVAVDADGNVLSSTNPTAGASAWRVASLGARFHSASIAPSISCPSTSLCVISLVAFGKGEFVVTSRRPTSGSWKAAPFRGGAGVSCPSASFCAAAALGSMKIAVSTKPTGGTHAWSARKIKALQASSRGHIVYDVSCPSKSLCVAVGGYGVIPHSYSPLRRPSTWKATVVQGLATGDRGFFYSVSCPSNSLCVAADRMGYATVGSG